MARVLITGGFGLIGSHLAERLLKEDFEVLVLDDSSIGRRSNLAGCVDSPRLQIHEGSVENSIEIERLIKQVDVCFHLAASLGVNRILDNPLTSYKTNVHGTENVLGAASKFKAKTFIASTSEIYGKNPNQPLNENSDRVLGTPANLRWIYSESKALDESLAHAFNKEQGLDFLIGRFFNVVGPRQTGEYGMVLPRFIKSALRNEPVKVYGNGTQTRVFCHVDDAVEAIMALMANPSLLSDTFNIGGLEEISIMDLAKRVIQLTNSKSEVELVPYEEAYSRGFEETMRRVPDISKIKEATGWAPELGLDEIVLQTANWIISQNRY